MEFQLLKKSARFLTLLLPLAFVACGGSNKPTEASPAPTQATTAKGCTGSYVGTIDKPSPEAVKAMREESLRRRGINPDDPIDRIQAVRTLEVSSEQEGIWMEGNFAFETDANCKVVKGGTNIFYTYPYAIEGTVKADRSFDIIWTGSGSTGQFVGQINPDGTISGQLKHPLPDDFIYGLLNGTFTTNGKI
jgi:hypothetical protein